MNRVRIIIKISLFLLNFSVFRREVEKKETGFHCGVCGVGTGLSPLRFPAFIGLKRRRYRIGERRISVSTNGTGTSTSHSRPKISDLNATQGSVPYTQPWAGLHNAFGVEEQKQLSSPPLTMVAARPH